MKFYKNFSINIIARIAIILLSGFGLIFFWTSTPYWAASFWMGILVVIFTIDLIYYTKKTKREMSNFLIAIKQGDFTVSPITIEKSKNKKDLKYAQNELNKVFQKLRNEKESDHHYLKTIVEHIKIALICFDTDGRIQLINEAAKILFDKPYLNNIKEFEKVDDNLFHMITQLKSGSKKLLKLVIKGKLYNLSLQSTTFKLLGKAYTLVSFQDIKNELDIKESDSWQKLIRVMTHEIKNSAIPISTLSAVTRQMLVDEDGQSKDFRLLNNEQKEDLIVSLKTIEERSKGLVKFIKAYSSLTKIPQPKFTNIKIDQLIDNITSLLLPELNEKQIKLSILHDDGQIILKADQALIEQTIINILLNAIDALDGLKDPKITIQTRKNHRKRPKVVITDNGKGIETELLDQIFVPFFTTKKNGSGVGLSFSRQVMQMHMGQLEVSSELGKGTRFSLIF